MTGLDDTDDVPRDVTVPTSSDEATIERATGGEYRYGFVSDIESEAIPKGLSDDVVRLISSKKGEPAWMLDWRLAALKRWRTMKEPRWPKVTYPPIDYQDIVYYSAPKSAGSGPEEPRRGRSRAAQDVREARRAPLGARRARRRRRRRRVRQRLRRDVVQGQARGTRHHLLLVQRGPARAPRTRPQVPGLGRAGHRQLLRDAQQRGLLRRLVRLRAQGRALPDGALDLLPHQRGRHRPVRAHADHRRRGRVRLLPRGMHGPQARHEPTPRRRGRARRARRRRDQVLDGPELVPRRQGRQGRHLQFRDQARRLPRRPQPDLVDAGRDRLVDHLEVPVLHPPGRRQRRRVLQRRAREQPPAGRHRHEDDPHRAQHPQHDRLEGHLGRPRPEHLPRARQDPEERRERAQLHAVRLAPPRLRRAAPTPSPTWR